MLDMLSFTILMLKIIVLAIMMLKIIDTIIPGNIDAYNHNFGNIDADGWRSKGLAAAAQTIH